MLKLFFPRFKHSELFPVKYVLFATMCAVSLRGGTYYAVGSTLTLVRSSESSFKCPNLKENKYESCMDTESNEILDEYLKGVFLSSRSTVCYLTTVRLQSVFYTGNWNHPGVNVAFRQKIRLAI